MPQPAKYATLPLGDRGSRTLPRILSKRDRTGTCGERSWLRDRPGPPSAAILESPSLLAVAASLAYFPSLRGFSRTFRKNAGRSFALGLGDDSARRASATTSLVCTRGAHWLTQARQRRHSSR